MTINIMINKSESRFANINKFIEEKDKIVTLKDNTLKTTQFKQFFKNFNKKIINNELSIIVKTPITVNSQSYICQKSQNNKMTLNYKF